MKINQLLSRFLAIICLIFIFTACSKDNDFASTDENGRSPSGVPGLINDSTFGGGNVNTDFTQEGYNEYVENPFVETTEEATSTFSIDADGGSYANVRRFLNYDQLPPAGAIRTEELINYFEMDYEGATDQHPIALNGEISSCPWTIGNKLLRIGIKGKDIPASELPNSNFVFLIDASGSMNSENKLELLKDAFKNFIDFLGDDDRIAIVTYGSTSQLVLPSTFSAEKNTIKDAIDALSSGGGTAGAQGIVTAYDIATQNFIEGGNNRVILGTDGDFNLGVSSQEGLIELIEEKRESGVFLSVLGVGTGNYQDGKMEQLANNGNGTYEYIDNLGQAEKVFINEYKKFFTVAKDVKVQITFDPAKIHAYRLIGYENRVLANEDFEDDTKDAGEIGANQTITALYELVPAIGPLNIITPDVSVDFRYKHPTDDSSIEITHEITDGVSPFNSASENMRLAATAAGFGMLLLDSEYKGNLNYDTLIEWVDDVQSYDPFGYRAEFKDLIVKAESL